MPESVSSESPATVNDTFSHDDVPRDTAMLLEFLRDHDAPCPVCGYNLRALTRPVCPECRQELELTVGAKRMRLGWWIMAMVPGFFSGIAAALLAVPITIVPLTEGGFAPWPIVVIDAFGWVSGISAVVLAARRVWFLRMSMRRQRAIAIAIWVVHIAMFFAFLFLMTGW